MARPFHDVGPEDLPQVWEKPSFEVLLACLKKLHVDPPIWNDMESKRSLRENQDTPAHHRREVISYLASIISNGLQWIKDDEQKEAIWEAASQCLSQRCGRAGMGEITRKWPFRNRQVPFELIVREPPITGDSLGHKTWGSSFLMAQLLDSLASGSLAHLLVPGCRESLGVLELGSGTGLLGIAAAAMWQVEVVLSDLPDIVTNLDYNIEQNRVVVEQLGGKMCSGILTWGSENGNDARFSSGHQFDIILAADSIYDDDHPGLLCSAIHDQLRDRPGSRAIVMVPIRDQITKRLISQFQSKMNRGTLPLATLEEHLFTGQDDWGDDDELQEVECWLAVFGRQPV